MYVSKEVGKYHTSYHTVLYLVVEQRHLKYSGVDDNFGPVWPLSDYLYRRQRTP